MERHDASSQRGWSWPGTIPVVGRQRADPVWRKAPLLLVRYPSLAVAVAAAVLVLALATASAPLFLSSAASAAMEEELATVDEELAGATVSLYSYLDPQTFGPANRLIREEAARVDGLGAPTLTINGSNVRLATAGSDGEDLVRVQFLSRTDAVEHLQAVEQTDGGRPGVWIAASTAAELGLGAGDTVSVRYGGGEASVPIAGVYRDLADVISTLAWTAPDPVAADSETAAYWRPLSSLIVAPSRDVVVQPPFLIGEPEVMVELAHQLGLPASVEWAFPYPTEGRSFAEVEAGLPQLRRFEAGINDPLSEAGEAIAEAHHYLAELPVVSGLPGVMSRVRRTVASLSGSVQALALATQVIALVVVAAAAVFAARRRGVEVTLLSTQGVSPAGQGLRAALEAIVPAVLGGLAGWAGASAVVTIAGPSTRLAPGAGSEALLSVAVATSGAVVLIGAVAAWVARNSAGEDSSRLREWAGKAPWELPVLTLAGAAYYEVVTRSSAVVGGSGEPRTDVFLLFFPILFIAGFAGLAVRGLGWLLPVLRPVPAQRATDGGSHSSLYLAARRLSAVRGLALLLVSASALAMGILVYAGTVAASTGATVAAKAAVVVGSDVAVELGDGLSAEGAAPFPTTQVGRGEARLEPGGRRVDILAVDPETFAGGAFWDPGFASRPLDELLAQLADFSGEQLPVIVAGGGGATALSSSQSTVAIDVVASTRAFPGMASGRPLVVVAAEPLAAAIAASGSSVDTALPLTRQLWARGDSRDIASFLISNGFPPETISTAREVRNRPDLVALGWTLGYLKAVGVAAGLLALVGMLLYLQARQQSREVAYVLARRMGLAKTSHRRSVALELAGMLGVAAVVGAALAVVAARLVNVHLDPLPDAAPAPLFVVPVDVLAGLVVAVLAVCAAGAGMVQRAADRAKVAEVLRVAG